MRYPSAPVISAHKHMKRNVKNNMINNKQPMDKNEREHEITSDNNSVEINPTNNSTATVTMDTTKCDNINGTNRNNDTPNVIMENINRDNSSIKSNNRKVPNQPVIFSAIPDDKGTDQTPHNMQTQLNPIVPETYSGMEVGTATMIVEQPPKKTEITDQKNVSTTNIRQKPEMSEMSETTKPETDVSVQQDLLQGKTTLEKITVETLLNMCDSMEFDDPELEENALLMPVDRPPEIPIEPKGDIPTQPLNPEIPLEADTKPDTPPPLEENDMDTTVIIEATNQISVTEDQSKPDDTKKPSKKRNRRNKKKTKKKKKSKTTQSDPDEVNKDIKQNIKTDKKGKPTTKIFVLRRGSKPKRRFYCMVGKCKKTCSTRKELNNHHITAHPKIVCDICNKLFDTPSSMNRHRYSHRSPKYSCVDCGKGFFFESELTSHRRCHLKIPGYSCFAKNCNKSYKREAELQVHVITHKKKRIDCPVKTCTYFMYDPRNLMQHNRQHMPMKFECIFCYKKFRYYEQKKQHEPKCDQDPAKLVPKKWWAWINNDNNSVLRYQGDINHIKRFF